MVINGQGGIGQSEIAALNNTGYSRFRQRFPQERGSKNTILILRIKKLKLN